MHAKSTRPLAIIVAILLFGIVATDQAASHKLSSFAVNAVAGVLGTSINLGSIPETTEPSSATATGPGAEVLAIPARAHSAELVAALRLDETPVEITAPAEWESALWQEEDSTGDMTPASSLFASPASGAGRFSQGARRAGGSAGGAVAGGVGGAPRGTSDRPVANRTTTGAAMGTDAAGSERRTSKSTLVASSEGVRPVSAPRGSRGASTERSSTPATSGDSVKPAGASDVGPAPIASSASKSPVLQGGSDPASVSVIPPVETSPEVQLPVDPVNASAPSALAEIAEELLTVPVAGVPVTFVAPVYAAEPLGGSQTLDTEWVVNPEPTTLLLFGTGLALAASRYRRRNQQRAAR